MEEILRDLTKIPGVLGGAIIGKDGLLIVSEGDLDVDPDFLAASSADFFANLENQFNEKLKQGNPELVEAETPTARWFFLGLNEMTFLVLKSAVQINLGLLRLELKSAKTQLMEIL